MDNFRISSQNYWKSKLHYLGRLIRIADMHVQSYIDNSPTNQEVWCTCDVFVMCGV